MSVISFIEDAGERLLGGTKANAAAGAAIEKYIAAQNLSAQGLSVAYDGASKTITVKGVAPDQPTKEKLVLCCGNVHSVAQVDDQLTVAQAPTAAFPPSTTYEVKAADTLSTIAKAVYGDAGDYERIFEANQPMLRDRNKIYPGQQLRIPPKG